MREIGGPQNKIMNQDFPGGPVVKTALPLQGMWVLPPVGERSCMLHSAAKNNNNNNEPKNLNV